MAGKTIKIISDQKNGRTPVYINGIGREIPHNSEEAVTDAELAVLENSGVEYEIVGDAKARDVKAADAERSEEAAPSVQSVQKPGGDHMRSPSPEADEPIVHTPKTDQVPGGDNMTGGVIHGGPVTGPTDEEKQEAKDTAEAARDGTIEPNVVLRNTDPDMQGLDASNPGLHGDEEVPLSEAARVSPPDRDGDGKSGGGINVEKILEGTVPEVLKKAERLDDDQRAALLKAEKAGKNRAGIVDHL